MFLRMKELESHTFETKEHQQKYLDNIRQCCIELLGMNVGVKDVEQVIRCVLKHVAGLVVDQLPQAPTLVRMLAEMNALSYQQIVEDVEKSDNLDIIA